MTEEAALAAIGVVSGYISGGSGGLSHSSDMNTYPKDLASVGDAYPREHTAAFIYKQGELFTDELTFEVHGDFRAYDQQILEDPNSIVWPVMANVYITLAGALAANKISSKSELSIAFKAMETAYGTPQDPRVRFLCEGHFDPALTGDTQFRVVLEVDQDANVNVIQQEITIGDGVLADNSPRGFSLHIE
jgi:hypothetical protein